MLNKEDRAEVNKLIQIILKYHPAGEDYDVYYYGWLRGNTFSVTSEWAEAYTDSFCREEAFLLLSEGKTKI